MMGRGRTRGPQKESVSQRINRGLRLFVLFSLCAFSANVSFAKLSWESTSKNFKCHPLQISETVAFNFTNTGLEPVTILELKPGCGCLSGKLDKKTYAPNESGTVHVTFNLEKRLGAQRKGITVKTDANPKKPTALYVNTTIAKTYVPSVKRLIWKPGEERKSKSCRITNAHKDPFQLVKAVAAQDGIKAELSIIREGYEYELIINPSPDLKNTLIPIKIYPEVPAGLTTVRSFTVYALLK